MNGCMRHHAPCEHCEKPFWLSGDYITTISMPVKTMGISGVNVLRGIIEPTAAAIAYSLYTKGSVECDIPVHGAEMPGNHCAG